MMFIIVDLPEPLAPIRATNSPGKISRVTPLDGFHVDLAGVVGFVDVFEFDDRLHANASHLAAAAPAAAAPPNPPPPPPNGLFPAGAAATSACGNLTAVTTRSPSFRPSVISV